MNSIPDTHRNPFSMNETYLLGAQVWADDRPATVVSDLGGPNLTVRLAMDVVPGDVIRIERDKVEPR